MAGRIVRSYPHHLGPDVDQQDLGEFQFCAIGNAAHLLDKMRRECFVLGQERQASRQQRVTIQGRIDGKRPPGRFLADRFQERVRVPRYQVSALPAMLQSTLVRPAAHGHPWQGSARRRHHDPPRADTGIPMNLRSGAFSIALPALPLQPDYPGKPRSTTRAVCRARRLTTRAPPASRMDRHTGASRPRHRDCDSRTARTVRDLAPGRPGRVSTPRPGPSGTRTAPFTIGTRPPWMISSSACCHG